MITASTPALSERIASESSHYYDRATGEPRYTIVGKNGKERAPYAREAIANDWVPSVTAITSQIRSYWLECWKQEQVLHAALTLPRLPDESLDDYARRVMDDAEAQSYAARAVGTAIHAAIEQALIGQRPARELEPFVTAALQQMIDLGLPSIGRAEHCFAADGYGGKVDYFAGSTTERSIDCVVDFKTHGSPREPKQLAYFERGMQLAAYAHGLGLPRPRHFQEPNFRPWRLVNIFILTSEPVASAYEWPAQEHDRLLNAFLLLKDYWWVTHKA